MSRFLIVGTSFRTLRDYLREHGHTSVTLKDIRLVKHPEARIKNRVVCDFSSLANMQTALDEVNAKYQIDGVLVTYEQYILFAAHIAQMLGLPGLPVAVAEACTDKQTMRQLFALSPSKISPDYQLVNSEQDVLDFASKHSYPLILKPANLAKSLLVTKNSDESELIANYRHTMSRIDAIYQKYAPARTPKLLIEEFMTGPIYSVDAFVDSSGQPHVMDQIVDYQTGYDAGYDDNFHYSRLLPSKLSTDQQDKIRQCAALGCKTLGMKNSAAHIEIILTATGPMIVEIGARNGGYRDRMHSLANGIDLIGNNLNLAMGRQPELKSSRSDHCAVIELFPKHPGIFKGIAHEHQARQLASLTYLDIKSNVGSYTGKSSDGYKMSAVLMLHNADRTQFELDLEFVKNNVQVMTAAD
jgi:biotin carboxylase